MVWKHKFDETKYKSLFINNITDHILYNKYNNITDNIKKRIKDTIKNHYCLPLDEFIFETNYEEIFIGDDPSSNNGEKNGRTKNKNNSCRDLTSARGNTILMKIKDLEYIFISASITKFQAPEQVINYWSSISNATEPCPLIETQKYWISYDKYYNKKNFKNKEGDFEDFLVYTCHFFPEQKGKKLSKYKILYAP